MNQENHLKEKGGTEVDKAFYYSKEEGEGAHGFFGNKAV